MGVVIKTKNLKGLLEMGAMAHQCIVLDKWGAEWIKGPAITIQIAKKGFTHVYKSTTINPGPAAVQSFLATVIHEHTDAIEGVKEPIHPSQAASEPDWDKMGVPTYDVIPLRKAKAMYQRVTGTSPSSVYVVVAISMKSRINVAAKVDGQALSVRVEGEGLQKQAVVNMLAKQGLTIKSKPEFTYMSQHYSCDDLTPPQKVLGAILLGSGIEFDTVMPSITKVVEGGS